MTTVKKLFNSIFVVVVFLFSGRFAVTRVLPVSQSSQEPTSTRLFALTDAAWSELRASAVSVDQDKGESKTANDKNEPSKSGDDKKEPSKSDKDKNQSKSGCDKDGSKSADDKTAPKDNNCDNSGAGGGDGDTGGGGG